MSRKDYQAFARILGDHLYAIRQKDEEATGADSPAVWPLFVNLKTAFEKYLKEDNPAFNEATFDGAIADQARRGHLRRKLEEQA